MSVRELIILFCGSAMFFGLLPSLIDKTGEEFKITLYIFGVFFLCLVLTCSSYYIERLIVKEKKKRLRKDRKDHNENLSILNDFCNDD